MEKKKILMPMLEAGAGHKMPALAVKESIDEMYPNKYQIDVIDYPKTAGALGSDKSLKWAWDMGLQFPITAKMGYRLMDTLYPLSMMYLPVMQGEFVKKGGEYVNNYKPDLIFSTHFFSASVAAMARDRYNLPIKVISYVTDPFDAYGWWTEKRLDYLCVASETAKERLLKRKVDEKKIKIFPFPIAKKFFRLSHSTEEVVKTYGIDKSMKTILTTEGGQGIGRIAGYVMEIYKRNVPVNIINVCGKNEKLKTKLEELKKNVKSKTNLIPLGFVNNMNELLSVSDVCVAKAGASTTFESLLMGVPIVFSSWATYSEKPNVDFCIDNKVGWYAPSWGKFKHLLCDIINGDVLDKYKKDIKNMKLHTGADEIAEFLINNIEGKI